MSISIRSTVKPKNEKNELIFAPLLTLFTSRAFTRIDSWIFIMPLDSYRLASSVHMVEQKKNIANID